MTAPEPADDIATPAAIETEARGAHKPKGYPLLWCDAVGASYWIINISFCGSNEVWRDWQKDWDMLEIALRIEALVHSTMTPAQTRHEAVRTGGHDLRILAANLDHIRTVANLAPSRLQSRRQAAA